MFFTNTYPRKQATALEGLLKNVRYYYLKKKNYKINNRHANVLFYPDYPKTGATLARTVRAMNMNITNNPKEGFDLVFFWKDETVVNDSKEILKAANLNENAFNSDCFDIGKKIVDETFEKIFGYSITIDPMTYSGRCLMKCNENALGEIDEIDCPVEKIDPDFVYQKIIDNTVNENYIADMRVLIFGEDIPFIIDKWIPKANQYKKKGESKFSPKYHLKNTNDLLSQEEQKLVIKMAKKMGLDCGEMDILRDKEDGKIYIVDVNKTPTMLVSRFSEEEQTMVYEKLTHFFKTNFMYKTKN
ncbi:MAG: hypothetical protein ACPG6V_11945 [Flavobacteriales bacterium]